MAIIHEDGTGIEDAETLCTVAEADLYHDARGNAGAWSSLDTDRKEQLLRAAYDYLRPEYIDRWPAGEPFGVADGAVPRDMKFASALLALKAKVGPLDPEIKAQKIESEVGPIKSKFAELKNPRRRFPDVDALVRRYLADTGTGSPFMVRLGRN